MKLDSTDRHLFRGISLFLGTILFGVSGYMIAGWDYPDPLYMVIITIFGVGYGEVQDLTPGLRQFTILLIVTGCTCLIYTLGAFVNWLTEGQLQQLLGKHKMDKEISSLAGHTVICGYGRVGRILAARLHEAKKAFVILEASEDQLEAIDAAGYLHLKGDATEESVLMQARIKYASVLATVIPNDAVNVTIVLSCRALNPKRLIISRANYGSTEAQLIQAGTDKVVMPAAMGADRTANLILKPNAQEVLEQDLSEHDFIAGLSDIGLEMGEIPISSGSSPIGRLSEPEEVESLVGEVYQNEALAGEVFFIHGGLRLGSKG